MIIFSSLLLGCQRARTRVIFCVHTRRGDPGCSAPRRGVGVRTGPSRDVLSVCRGCVWWWWWFLWSKLLQKVCFWIKLAIAIKKWVSGPPNTPELGSELTNFGGKNECFWPKNKLGEVFSGNSIRDWKVYSVQKKGYNGPASFWKNWMSAKKVKKRIFFIFFIAINEIYWSF